MSLNVAVFHCESDFAGRTAIDVVPGGLGSLLRQLFAPFELQLCEDVSVLLRSLHGQETPSIGSSAAIAIVGLSDQVLSTARTYLSERHISCDWIVFIDQQLAQALPRRSGTLLTEVLMDSRADNLFSAVELRGRAWQRDANGIFHGDGLFSRQWIEDGRFYAFRTFGGDRTSDWRDSRATLPLDLSSLQCEAHLSPSIAEIERIRLIVFDFDGVMTDDRVLVMEDGREAVVCNRGDGLGLELLRQTGIEAIVISRESNRVVAARCAKLKLPCCHGILDKLSLLKEECRQRGLTSDQVAYVGNDLNDLECLNWVGLPVAVKNAIPVVRQVARYTTVASGGDGAVREVTDWFRNEKSR